MGKILEELVEKSICLANDLEKIKISNPQYDYDFYYSAAKEKLVNQIIDEIINEEKDKIILDANSIINKKIENGRLKRKIQDLKMITFLGIFISFLVGLVVNQITEIILVLKGADAVFKTIVIALLIIIIIVLIVVGYLFINNSKYKV